MSAPHYKDIPNNGAITLTSTDTTVGKSILTPGANGTRVDELSIISGPTTPPGGAWIGWFLLNDVRFGDKITLVNTVDTIQYGPKVLGNLVLKSTDTFKFQSMTALAAGATLHIVANAADLSA